MPEVALKPPENSDRTAREDRAAREFRSKRWRRGAAAALVLGSLLLLLASCGGDGGPNPVGFASNPVDGGAPETGPSLTRAEDFVGAAACRGCHAELYARWSASTHGRAGGEPGPETVIAPFDGSPVVFRDGTVVPGIGPGGAYRFVVRQDAHPERIFTVDGVIGGGHMLGGGTQGYVTRASDGTVRLLPFEYSRQLPAWFCNTGTRKDQGWVPVDGNLALADCGDWPPVRVLGSLSRFANCQACHGSQIRSELVVGSGVSTRWTSLAINCESCHGPAARHVEIMEASQAGTERPPAGAVDGNRGADNRRAVGDRRGGSDFGEAGDIGIPTRVTDGVEASLEVCFQCHALKDRVSDGYLPGERLTDYYALKLPVLGDDPYLPDGRVRTFAYQGTHLSSACYLDGNMSCVSCHEPHGMGYWDTHRRPLANERDDRQCTACHASKASDPEFHTFHPADSPGSRCVSCHMPFLQHPEVGDAVPFARADHTIPIPRPGLDGRLGLTSACRGCHQDRSEVFLQRQVEGWWGELKPHDPPTAGLLGVTRNMGERQAARMLLHPEVDRPMAQFLALARFLMAWVRPGVGLDSIARERTSLLADSPDLDLQALALATLHAAGPESNLPPAATSPETRPLPIRRRWAMILGFLADEALEQGDPAAAEALYEKALDVLPEDAAVLRSLGLVHSAAGDFPAAIRRFAESLASDPNQPLVHVNQGIARAASGDQGGAIRSYLAALRADPNESLAYFNLGNLHLRGGRVAEALRAYERAVALAPEMSRAHLNLGIALQRAGRSGRALYHIREAVALSPSDDMARRVLAELGRGSRDP